MCIKKEGPAKDKAKPADEFKAVVAFMPVKAARQMVLLFGDLQAGIRAEAIPDTDERFPFGRVMVINLTGERFRMELGGTAFPGPPTKDPSTFVHQSGKTHRSGETSP